MKRSLKTTVCLLGCFVLTARVRAVVNETTQTNTYCIIAERNVFGLKPPTPPPAPAPVAPPPPANVRLTGITSILGDKRALFLVQESPTRGKSQKEESYILTEGQRQGVLEVLEINEQSGKVKIKNDGNVSVVTFDTIKLPSAPVGAPASPVEGVPVPPVPNAAAAQPVANQTALPGGILRRPRTEPDTQLSPEAQAILVEEERERTRSQVEAGRMPPLPPNGRLPNSQPPSIPNRQSTSLILPSLPVH
jgi:hypothetical protein